MTLGDLVAFNAYLAFLYVPAQSLVSFGIGIQTSFAALERVFQLLQLVPEDDEDTTKPSVNSIHGNITFEHVCFSYDGQKNVLSDVCFSTRPGELVALLGPSGAGKTTLMSLIIQLYKPSSGTIRLDGTDVRVFNLRSVRERIGIVSQDAFLFDSTIIYNIRYARLTPRKGRCIGPRIWPRHTISSNSCRTDTKPESANAVSDCQQASANACLWLEPF